MPTGTSGVTCIHLHGCLLPQPSLTITFASGTASARDTLQSAALFLSREMRLHMATGKWKFKELTAQDWIQVMARSLCSPEDLQVKKGSWHLLTALQLATPASWHPASWHPLRIWSHTLPCPVIFFFSLPYYRLISGLLDVHGTWRHLCFAVKDSGSAARI